jgi:uncharacterized protein YjcR
MDGQLTYDDRYEWAKLLYTRHDYNLRDTALETGIEEATVRNWMNEGGWDGMKRSLLTSKNVQLGFLYKLLDTLSAKISNTEEASLKDADLYAKYTASIKNLEQGLSVNNIMEVSGMFLKWLQRKDIELARKVSVHFDSYVKHKKSSLR